MPLKFARDGESPLDKFCKIPAWFGHPCICWKGEFPAGSEIDWRGLNLLGMLANGIGDVIPGLWVVEVALDSSCDWKANPGLLEADEVGMGGEKGNAGY